MQRLFTSFFNSATLYRTFWSSPCVEPMDDPSKHFCFTASTHLKLLLSALSVPHSSCWSALLSCSATAVTSVILSLWPKPVSCCDKLRQFVMDFVEWSKFCTHRDQRWTAYLNLLFYCFKWSMNVKACWPQNVCVCVCCIIRALLLGHY